MKTKKPSEASNNTTKDLLSFLDHARAVIRHCSLNEESQNCLDAGRILDADLDKLKDANLNINDKNKPFSAKEEKSLNELAELSQNAGTCHAFNDFFGRFLPAAPLQNYCNSLDEKFSEKAKELNYSPSK